MTHADGAVTGPGHELKGSVEHELETCTQGTDHKRATKLAVNLKPFLNIELPECASGKDRHDLTPILVHLDMLALQFKCYFKLPS